MRGDVLSLRTEILNNVVQELVGILSHTKREVSTELPRGIGVKDSFGYIDLGEVGKCSRGCFKEVYLCLH